MANGQAALDGIRAGCASLSCGIESDHGPNLHVTALQLPPVVLPRHYGTQERDEGLLVGEEAALVHQEFCTLCSAFPEDWHCAIKGIGETSVPTIREAAKRPLPPPAWPAIPQPGAALPPTPGQGCSAANSVFKVDFCGRIVLAGIISSVWLHHLTRHIQQHSIRRPVRSLYRCEHPFLL